MRGWLRDAFAGRPAWMNAMMVFCAFMTFFYVPWDLFWKPVSQDEEVWFGIVLSGWNAKLATPLHWFVYGALLYGFRRMRPWIRVAASAYLAQVTIGMFVWSFFEYGSLTGFVLGVIAAVPFAALTTLVWNAHEHFPAEQPLAERYGGWALVTGASSGIGAELARALAAQGMPCVLTARRRERLDALAAELERDHGVETRVVEADLAASDGPDRLVERIGDLEISILVNNAGAGYMGRFDLQDEARLRDVVQLNCVAPLVLTRRLLPAMKQRGRGAVLVTGSVSGRQPIPLHAVYSASKAFALYLGEALWVELRGSGVDALVLEPGTTADTGFQAAAGQLPHGGQSPAKVAARAVEALGKQPSVMASWFDWARAEIAQRVAPRNLVTYVAHGVMAKHAPADMR